MLTAAVRDLHRCLPGEFLTDVRTSCPQLWENSPYITPLAEDGPGVEVIECQYPLVHQSNQASCHFIHGYIEFLNERLGGRIRPTAFKGDVHLSEAERSWPSPVAELAGQDLPYWIIVGGGKYDFTIKWWSFQRHQRVIDLLRGRILFVQVGEEGHFHPPLSGVIDLRGNTSTRELIRLMHHAQGVVSPVTFLMHLAAAVEMRDRRGARPCVVVAGGREPPHWEAYPHHQFIHTIGALSCCATGGCWRSRTVALGDGDEKDDPGSLCVDVVDGLPRCMNMITPEEVVRRIELYISGGAVRCLTRAESAIATPLLKRTLFEQLTGAAAAPRA
jgi:ADP-heptose:LPS heptosyltransferase